MIKVVISGFYGFDNVGDEAILQAVIEQFRKAHADIDIAVLSATPQNTAETFNVRAVKRTDIFGVFNAIRKSDALISGGGSLLQDVTSKRSIWYYVGIIFMAFMLGKPVYAFAQGIGPIHGRFNRILSRYVLKRVRYISVRDSISKDELIRLGVDRTAECTADPALMLQPVSKDKGMDILFKEVGVRKEDRPLIGFYIRSWASNPDATAIFAQLADRLIDDINAIVVFVPFHHDVDLITSKEIISKMRNDATVITHKYLPSEIMSVVGLMDLCVSVRLHGIILSTRMGVPAVAISYDPKVDNYMYMIGMEPASKYDSLDVEILYESAVNTWNEREAISKRTGETAMQLEAVAREGVQHILDDMHEISREA